MFKNYHALLSVFISLFLFSCVNNSANVVIQGGDYPEGAEIMQFNEIGQPSDSLKLIAEIDIFEGSKVPVGEINDMEEIGDKLYFADRKQNLIHIIDKETLNYKTSIGGPGPDQLLRIFGLSVTDDNNIMIGNSQGPHLLKSFSPNGDFLKSYPNNNPPARGIAVDINGSFISDSIAYVTNQFADKGTKLIRYDLRGGEANKIDDIVPVTDLHTELDSAMLAKIIHRMSVLKSKVVDSLFYVVPTNKYLINSYNMKGDKMSSIDLRGIPQINTIYSIMKKTFYGYSFNSAVIDDQDNIYFHIIELEGIEIDDSPEVMDAKMVDNNSKVILVSVNLLDKTYRTFKVEQRHISPLKIIDDKLWCFDQSSSQLLLYQFPDK